MSPDEHARRAMTHFYFCNAVIHTLTTFNGDGVANIGDVLGVGEDVLVQDLYPYSMILHDELDNFDFLGSELFEITGSLATYFWVAVNVDDLGNLPDALLFTEEVRRQLTELKSKQDCPWQK